MQCFNGEKVPILMSDCKFVPKVLHWPLKDLKDDDVAAKLRFRKWRQEARQRVRVCAALRRFPDMSAGAIGLEEEMKAKATSRALSNESADAEFLRSFSIYRPGGRREEWDVRRPCFRRAGNKETVSWNYMISRS